MSAELKEWPPSGRVVVYDLEYTAWPGSLERRWTGPGEHREIVQIGAVSLDAGRCFAELAAFEVLVTPTRNPRLSAYFVELTGIDDAMLAKDGVPFVRALNGFIAFVGEAPLLANGIDADVVDENCRLNDTPNPLSRDRSVNIRPALATAMGLPRDRLMSSRLPSLLELDVVHDPHTGLGDARAIAAALAELRRRGKI
jgi:DNA polymerase III epsilon subunit-like protein